ncbi:hypothetical protein QBC34DRAFT_499608 [Podospora aff. communis PSN243]|uniref:Cyanovirin-N domain-containing protein n=1 Tax=Podospora aff. communis PSN243 TaxID=3040156 RepID=A0AAV9G576_9PEZI|nr:hypothetical protein QBC34DRAFT_499608 [Podospora aff. communis PSN243]
MRLPILGLSAALAATCVADNMAAYTVCYDFIVGYTCRNEGVFITSSGGHHIGADIDNGCYDSGDGLPGHMQELCVDWSLNRAHFRFTDQGVRCLQRRIGLVISYSCPAQVGSVGICRLHVWEEVGCTWISREAAPAVGQDTTGKGNKTVVEPPVKIPDWVPEGFVWRDKLPWDETEDVLVPGPAPAKGAKMAEAKTGTGVVRGAAVATSAFVA